MRLAPQFQRQESEEGLKRVRSFRAEICVIRVIRLIRDSDNYQKAWRDIFNCHFHDSFSLVFSSH